MSFISGLLGNASQVDREKAQEQFGQILSEGEQIERAYQLIRDYFLFTNTRLVLIDQQGLTGKKVEYHSIPYKSITHFSVETAGQFDLDAELKIWLSGMSVPIEKTFNSKLNIYEVQAILAQYVAR